MQLHFSIYLTNDSCLKMAQHRNTRRCQAEPVAKFLPHPRLSKVNCRRHVKKTVWRQSIFKNKVHLNSMLQIGFINSLQQLLKKQSQSMSSCVIWLPELEGLIKPSTLEKKKKPGDSTIVSCFQSSQ